MGFLKGLITAEGQFQLVKWHKISGFTVCPVHIALTQISTVHLCFLPFKDEPRSVIFWAGGGKGVHLECTRNVSTTDNQTMDSQDLSFDAGK